MASRTTTKKSSGFQIRRVATKEDRKRPSVFMRLKVEEAFKGVALFEPDPELKGNPGYFEYYDHFDTQANAYVPCAGEKCPFCAANMNPSTRALTAWYMPEATDPKDKIKVFTMNYSTTQDITDESEDEGGILGKVIRIKRLEPAEKGNYKVKVTTDKPLTKVQLKAAMAELEEKFPDGLEGLVERQLKVQMERLKAMEALDDDEDEDEPRPSRRGTKAEEPDEEPDEDEETDEEKDEDEEPEEDADEESEGSSEIEEGDYEILRVSRKNNSVTVEFEGEEVELYADADDDEIDLSEFKKGDTVTLTALWDEDEEVWSLTSISSSEEEPEEEEDPEEESSEINDATYEVLKVQEKDEIFDLQNDDGKVKMWLGDQVEVDYEEVKRGVQVVINAAQDDEGDWIITAIEPVKAKPARTRSGTKTKTASKTTSTRKTTTRKR